MRDKSPDVWTGFVIRLRNLPSHMHTFLRGKVQKLNQNLHEIL